MGEKGPKGGIFALNKLENLLVKEKERRKRKRKDEERRRRGKRKKRIVARLVFVWLLLAEKKCLTQEVLKTERKCK